MHSSVFNLFLAVKKTIVNPSKVIAELDVHKVITEEPKKSESLPQVNVDKTLENEVNVCIVLVLF